MKKILAEFKSFAIKGNMFDMAVGIIVGGAFSAVVNSIVTNIITPLIGILVGVNLKDWKVVLPRLYGNAEPSVLNIGMFLDSLINLFVVSVTMFIIVKAINTFRKKNEAAEPAPPKPSKEELLLEEIRDILKEQQK
ncbi:MAG: large-conductance mechanosensitive channel protein MscL [Oscillospiraceae bacterium]|nr:large-conductance mechanosensitive channel protein MscL [Oscillospiraceae bacterium]